MGEEIRRCLERTRDSAVLGGVTGHCQEGVVGQAYVRAAEVVDGHTRQICALRIDEEMAQTEIAAAEQVGISRPNAGELAFVDTQLSGGHPHRASAADPLARCRSRVLHVIDAYPRSLEHGYVRRRLCLFKSPQTKGGSARPRELLWAGGAVVEYELINGCRRNSAIVSWAIVNWAIFSRRAITPRKPEEQHGRGEDRQQLHTGTMSASDGFVSTPLSRELLALQQLLEGREVSLDRSGIGCEVGGRDTWTAEEAEHDFGTLAVGHHT